MNESGKVQEWEGTRVGRYKSGKVVLRSEK